MWLLKSNARCFDENAQWTTAGSLWVPSHFFGFIIVKQSNRRGYPTERPI